VKNRKVVGAGESQDSPHVIAISLPGVQYIYIYIVSTTEVDQFLLQRRTNLSKDRPYSILEQSRSA
jgi:hypothetical protein